ncbi:hypothetical protein [Citricoccus sp. GCM10030269]|uniref:hypothetical protein n=1 Tax=Citricoccus sp. GCM10030269 TaxID=3273388 RepID=UPI003608DBF2
MAADSHHTLALREDGTVYATGDNHFGQCDVQSWTDVRAISAGSTHSLGLLAEGTVVAAGDYAENQCDVSTWRFDH